MVKIFVDSDMDFTTADCEALNVSLISMPYTHKGELKYPGAEGEDLHAYYDDLRNGEIVTTSSLNRFEYITAFEPELEKGNDILYIHFSREMSSTFEEMDAAIAELKEKYPKRTITTIDTRGICLVSRVIAEEIIDLVYNKGFSVNKVKQWASTEVEHFAGYFFTDNLKFFGRSGRVKGITAAMGNLFGVKPLIYMGEDGKMTNYSKVMGTKKALRALVDKVGELGLELDKHNMLIEHTDNEPLANELARLIRERFPEVPQIDIRCLNPTIGAHCGPDTIGVAFHAIHR